MFAVIWAASTAGHIGIAKADTTAARLMTSLNADPAAVNNVDCVRHKTSSRKMRAAHGIGQGHSDPHG
jgi:hypothetical protein